MFSLTWYLIYDLSHEILQNNVGTESIAEGIVEPRHVTLLLKFKMGFLTFQEKLK